MSSRQKASAEIYFNIEGSPYLSKRYKVIDVQYHAKRSNSIALYIEDMSCSENELQNCTAQEVSDSDDNLYKYIKKRGYFIIDFTKSYERGRRTKGGAKRYKAILNSLIRKSSDFHIFSESTYYARPNEDWRELYLYDADARVSKEICCGEIPITESLSDQPILP